MEETSDPKGGASDDALSESEKRDTMEAYGDEDHPTIAPVQFTSSTHHH